MKSNLIRQIALNYKNYTKINNEILFRKDISLESKSVFVILKGLPPNWHLSIEGLKPICNCGKTKLQKCLNELEQIGYLKREKTYNEKGQFDGYKYYMYETLDPELWDTPQNRRMSGLLPEAENQDMDKPYPQNPDTENPAAEKPYTENQPQLIINNINNLLNNNLNNTKESQNSLRDTSQENLNNLFMLKTTCSNEDFETETSLGNNLNKLTNVARKVRKKDRENVIKNKVQQKELQKNEIVNVTNTLQETFADLTEADNVLAQTKKMVNELKEEKQRLELQSQKKTGRRKRVNNWIDTKIKDVVLAITMKDYMGLWIDAGKPVNEDVLNAQIDKLYSLSQYPQERIEIVKKSILHGWLGLYELKSQNKENVYKPKSKKQVSNSVETQETQDDRFEKALDENGNPLLF